MSFFAELKRRNVFRVAAAYAVVAWLLAGLPWEMIGGDESLGETRDEAIG